MQNEILKPVLETDEVAVPRYDIVGPNGAVVQQNVELRLKNEVVQEGTPYDEESVLPASLREQLELPQSATPAEAMAALLTKGGGAVRRNRPPLTTDAEQVGKLWVVPEMFFNNLMPNTLAQVAGNWQSSNATVAVSGNTATFTGNGAENSVDVQADMLASAKAGDKIFVQATVKVNHDANSATIQLICGEQTLATKTLDVPAAGDTMLLQAVATMEASGALVLRVHSAYNTAAVQSGKSLTISAITVWNLTEDMCEAQEGNEFTEAEAANYISSFGQFQSKEYEYSTWWWVLRGVTDDVYLWHRMYDYATTGEAQAGTDDTKLMSALKTQQFLTSRLATQSEADAGTSDIKWMSPKKVKAWWDKLYSTLILPVTNGGTGRNTAFTTHGLLYAESATKIGQKPLPTKDNSALLQNSDGSTLWRQLYLELSSVQVSSTDPSTTYTYQLAEPISDFERVTIDISNAFNGGASYVTSSRLYIGTPSGTGMFVYGSWPTGPAARTHAELLRMPTGEYAVTYTYSYTYTNSSDAYDDNFILPASAATDTIYLVTGGDNGRIIESFYLTVRGTNV